MNGDGTISKRIQSIMSDRTNKSSLTLRCLKPYLVLYRSLGLLPLHFDSDDDGGIVPAGWSWKRPGWKLYSSVVLLIVTAYLADKLPGQLVMGSLSSDDAIHLLEAANTSSFSLNVSVTLFMCFLYLSRRLCGLIQRMVRCEKELLGLGCCSLDGDRVTIISCWAVLALGIVATLANESVYAIRRHEDHSMESSATMATLTLFRTVSTAFAAGAWPFVDYSVIQLSLVLSCYQRHLRQLIEDGWTSADLSRKERFRMSYLEVQALIKDADEIFSPAVLIGSLSCVAHLILQINIGLRMEYRPDEHQHLTDVMQTTWTSAAYVALRFCASSYFAEKIHEEVMMVLLYFMISINQGSLFIR